MLRRAFGWAVAAVVLCTVLAVSAMAAEEVLFYRVEGAFSPYKYAQVTIDTSGRADIVYDYLREGEKKATFMLSPDELEACRTAIRASGALTAEPTDRGYAIDAGSTTLRISIDGQKKSLKFGASPEMAPVVRFAWLLIDQATVIDQLNTKGKPYDALVAASDHLVGAKVLQPRALVDPLKACVRKDDSKGFLVAIEALAWLTTPQEWIGFVSEQFGKKTGQTRAEWLRQLTTHPFYADIPKEHTKVLREFVLIPIKDYYPRWDSLTKEEQRVVDMVVVFFLENDTIPLLLQLNPRRALLDRASAAFFVSRPDLIDLLIGYLKSDNHDLRLSAIYELGDIYTVQAGKKFGDRVLTAQDIARARAAVEPAIPALRTIAKEDRDSEVRQWANSALDKIDKGQKQQ